DPGMMPKGALVSVSPAAVAASVYPVPLLLILSVAKVATPLIAATVVVPERTPAPGFASIATVTVPVKPVTVLPSASRAVTCTAGLIVAPAVVVPGGTVNASWLAAPGTMLKATLVVPERLKAVAERV